MFTILRFTPLGSTYAPFSFVLHPHLSKRNMIDDDLLQLSFFLEAKASVKLVQDVPNIRSLRSGLGIYLNHQLLGSTSSLLHDGDIVAFPQRRHNLKTAVRYRVDTEVVKLSCGVEQELPALRGCLQEMREEKERGISLGTSFDSAKALDPIGVGTAAPRTFSYAALVASSAPPIPHPSTPAPMASDSSSAVASRSLLRLSSPRATTTSVSTSVLTAASMLVSPNASPPDIRAHHPPVKTTSNYRSAQQASAFIDSAPSAPVIESHSTPAPMRDSSNSPCPSAASQPVESTSMHDVGMAVTFGGARSPDDSVSDVQDDSWQRRSHGACPSHRPGDVDTAELAVQRMRTAWKEARRLLCSVKARADSIEVVMERVRGAWMQIRSTVVSDSLSGLSSEASTARPNASSATNRVKTRLPGHAQDLTNLLATPSSSASCHDPVPLGAPDQSVGSFGGHRACVNHNQQPLSPSNALFPPSLPTPRPSQTCISTVTSSCAFADLQSPALVHPPHPVFAIIPFALAAFPRFFSSPWRFCDAVAPVF
ncbi:unnamed protein product [Tilletia controversa]|uniref:FHA domain-containing protein n=1 Tax=Tilletia controversa TaxID=13291 RepID=A0A8X7MJW7_9BASI|nr:hypothetical protein CF328_g8726 [Tilletia controversa]KAE8238655.1 hypothetical protein A4X06_0g8675 [Tilletia controversa]CAD6953522.1 unnamed protein product [Tilletia controversa]CAD6978386.1 unnamed protein product [Tilletia controversa]